MESMHPLSPQVLPVLCLAVLLWGAGCKPDSSGTDAAPGGARRTAAGGGAGTLAGDTHLQSAIKANGAGDYVRAIEETRQALAKGVSPQVLSDTHTIQGNAYTALERYDEAVASHEKALEVDPRSHKAWANLGVTYRRSGKLDKAEECYKRSLEIKSDYADAHVNLGALYLAKNDARKAVEELEYAVKLDPGVGGVAYGNLALAYAIAGRFDEADATLKQAVAQGYASGQEVRKRIDNLKALR
jgi:tetratricopeptide (TPR) repeat protein